MGILISAVGINPRDGPGPPFGFNSFRTPTILKVRPTVTPVFCGSASVPPNGRPKKPGRFDIDDSGNLGDLGDGAVIQDARWSFNIRRARTRRPVTAGTPTQRRSVECAANGLAIDGHLTKQIERLKSRKEVALQT